MTSRWRRFGSSSYAWRDSHLLQLLHTFRLCAFRFSSPFIHPFHLVHQGSNVSNAAVEFRKRRQQHGSSQSSQQTEAAAESSKAVVQPMLTEAS
eukprot:scaffold14867_cov139-Skeletonema_dohrnii-CCMP3373.AAC.6